MKPLKDGEKRTMRPGIWADRRIEVVAHRVDCDTPYVTLLVGGEPYCLTDVGAEELIERLKRALSILPTSK